jgi:tetratricopeptide (TPR) repeat protein
MDAPNDNNLKLMQKVLIWQIKKNRDKLGIWKRCYSPIIPGGGLMSPHKTLLVLVFLFPLMASAQKGSESFQKAEDFLKQGKLEMALLFYNREINERPDNGLAYFSRGKIHFYNKAYTNALQDFKRAADLLPKNKDVLYAQANALAMTGSIDEAIRAYERLISLDRRFAFAYLNLGNIYLRSKKDKEKTILYWEQFLGLLPQYEQAEDIRKAISYLRSDSFSWADIDPVLKTASSDAAKGADDSQGTNRGEKLDLESILPDLDIEAEGSKADVSKQKGMAEKKSIETE